jgi:hypothetical protein
MRDEPPTNNGESASASRTSSKKATTLLGRLVRHRLTHFFLIGGILFALAPAPKESRRIRVDPEVLAAMTADEAKKSGKATLSAEERRLVEARAVEDELLYREALRLRIAEGDVIVRQRLVQKLLVLAEDIDGASGPLSDAALQDCFSKTKEKWKLPASIQFVHVVGSSRETLGVLRDQVVAFSADPAHDQDIPPFGESFATSRRVTGTIEDVKHAFGADFAAAIEKLPVRTWSEVIPSKYGMHLVRVLTANAEKQATLDDVRALLNVECQMLRREEAVHRYTQRLFGTYEVFVGNDRVRELQPTHRTAPRGEMSGEDG